MASSCTVSSDVIKSLVLNRPTVLIDDTAITPILDTVMTPGLRGMRTATGHLLARGCKRFAYLGGVRPDDDTAAAVHAGTLLDSGESRSVGFLATLQTAGLDCPADRFIPADMLIEPGVEAGHRIADERWDIDGIVCSADALAFGVIRGLADRGVRVPQDIRVIGFDGISLGRWSVPSLSTVAVDMNDMAQRCMSMLTSRIDGTYTGAPRRETAACTLSIRESSR